MSQSNPFATPASEINPYAAPQTVSELPTNVSGVWRSGKILVMHRDAQLPDICIKSNEPTQGYRLKRKLVWHHPAIALTILLNVIIYIIVAAIVSKRATVMIGLSPQWQAIRRRRISIGWGGFLGGLVLAGVGLAMLGPRGAGNTVGPFLMIGGFIVSFSLGIYGLFAARLISPRKIDNQYIYIKGACPEFLDRFEAIQTL